MKISDYKYLKYVPKPFLQDIIENKCIPFIGAGMSRNAVLSGNNSMPLWDDLGKSFAEEIPDYTYYSAVDAISAFEHEFSRAKLVEKLSRELHVGYAEPGKVHKSFCNITFDIICTTNFDFLLEEAYQSNRRYCHPVIEEDSLSISSSRRAVQLIKFHGDLHHPNKLIATEKDYDLFIDKNPMMCTFLSNLLITRTAFFVGYSLEDPDFRNIWSIIGERLGRLRREAYTLAVNAKPHQISRFERRGVKVINLPGKAGDYSSILSDFFVELKEYMESEILNSKRANEEDTQLALSLPKEENNRLCFFLVPHELYSFYRSEIFPIVEMFGLTPVMTSDIIMPGENLLAISEALLNRAEYLIADISSANSMFEVGFITTSKINMDKTILVVDKTKHIPVDLMDYSIISRPENVLYNSENFFEDLKKSLNDVVLNIEESRLSQPRRLLEAKEYSAAVITVFSLLENYLNEMLQKRERGKKSGFGLRGLLQMAVKYEIINRHDYTKLIQWSRVRNELAHTSMTVKKADAIKIVEGIYGIVSL